MSTFLPVSKRDRIDDWRKDPRAIEKYSFLEHFLPHPKKNRRAKLLSPRALLCYGFFIAIIFGVFKLIPCFFPGVLGYASDITVKELYEVTNRKREESGLSNLVLSDKLSHAAYKKALDMFEDGYWAHVAPDGTEPWHFILQEDYDYSYAGENLAKNFGYSREVVEAWIRSPSHRDNLLNKNYTEVGYAVVNGVLDGYETTLVVQMFGKSRQPSLVATKAEEEKILESIEVARAITEEVVETMVEKPAVSLILPAVDVVTATKSLNVVFGGFVLSLLGLDFWYSKKHGIAKVTGHTLAHALFLLVALVGMWLAFVPGKVL